MQGNKSQSKDRKMGNIIIFEKVFDKSGWEGCNFNTGNEGYIQLYKSVNIGCRNGHTANCE
jgi:hypothetical protein